MIVFFYLLLFDNFTDNRLKELDKACKAIRTLNLWKRPGSKKRIATFIEQDKLLELWKRPATAQLDISDYVKLAGCHMSKHIKDILKILPVLEQPAVQPAAVNRRNQPEDGVKCVKCDQHLVNQLALPCRHLTLCTNCVSNVNDTCTECNLHVQEFPEIFCSADGMYKYVHA